MSEQSINYSLPDEALALASAIALRSADSQVIVERIGAGLQGLEYVEKSPEELRSIYFGRTVLFLSKVENPELMISFKEIADATYITQNFQVMATEMSEASGETVNPEAVRDVVSATATEMKNGAGLTDEIVTMNFKKTLSTARQVALEHGTDVATVYSTDELYYETASRAFTPAESAGAFCKSIDSFSTDILNKILLQHLETIMPKEILDELSYEDIVEIAAEMQLDPGLQQSIIKIVDNAKEVMRQSGTFLFLRTYGANAIQELTLEIQQTLKPQKPLVAEVFNTLKG